MEIYNRHLGMTPKLYLKKPKFSISDRSISLSYYNQLVIAKKIAIGLGHLHLHGILHRDLKSFNVLVSTRVLSGRLSTLVTDTNKPN